MSRKGLASFTLNELSVVFLSTFTRRWTPRWNKSQCNTPILT